MTKNLVIQSLLRALAAKRPAAGLIHHSNRGSKYCAWEYTLLFDRFGMRASMNRNGYCCDNALMESFWVCSRTYRSTIAGMQLRATDKTPKNKKLDSLEGEVIFKKHTIFHAIKPQFTS